MVQKLLADRFQMKLHRETRDLPVYGLIVAKGAPKIKETPPDSEAGSGGAVNVTGAGGHAGVSINFGGGSSFAMADNRFEGKKLAMTSFADTLARFVDRPVIDMTELKGNYDLTMELSPEDFQVMQIRAAIAAGVVLPPGALKLAEGASDESLQNALQGIGLKLDRRKAPLEVLVIDRAEKVPTG